MGPIHHVTEPFKIEAASPPRAVSLTTHTDDRVSSTLPHRRNLLYLHRASTMQIVCTSEP